MSLSFDPNYAALEPFVFRHNGSTPEQVNDMLSTLDVESVDDLMDQIIPPSIQLRADLRLPTPKTEEEIIDHLKAMMSKNKIFTSYIGTGYYDCHTPKVIQRNILENPGWYTAYTPYQAEIAQGRLEALMNFQTVVSDLTGLPIANASLLDEATAAAEAMSLLYAVRKASKQKASVFFIDENTFPQVIAVVTSRGRALGITVEVGSFLKWDLSDPNLFGVYIQNPGNDGRVYDFTSFIAGAYKNEVYVAVGTDLMSLTILKSPGEMNADVAVGNSQRFGVPLGYGGPHAAFFATRSEYKRLLPGRIIGVSVDAQGRPAYRMALQTREQHIRREKATSNICTAQVLLAVMAGMYAVYHGPRGLKKIASRIHGLALGLANALGRMGFEVNHNLFFDTLLIRVPQVGPLQMRTESLGINFRYFDSHTVAISLDETTTRDDVIRIMGLFEKSFNKSISEWIDPTSTPWPDALIRSTSYLDHPVFHNYHTEHEMLRYIKLLENRDLSLTHSMISLGSCTMKLNATTEMMALTWPEVNALHPFVPIDQAQGYQELILLLERVLQEITGFTAVSLQPNSGAQGEYAGLLTIRAYHISQNEAHRNIALIPASSHGTNPASAVMAGMKVVIIKSNTDGTIDMDDLKEKVIKHGHELGAFMVTYPSTHGVYEENIHEICALIHQYHGLVYMDGANMNAQVGLTSPAKIGADVCHLNLHKTFAIPHGGGGPGMGPICVNDKLKPFLPGHVHLNASPNSPPVSAAPWGSASILTISYAYIALMGGAGLTQVTQMAMVNANYLKEKLASHYVILYQGKRGHCAHEFIVDCRPFKEVNIDVEDIAKRLMDYGFHAPTVSFPVAGTLMIEPTESESKAELDRFVEAMISIRKEIEEIEKGHADIHDNVLKHAPHTIHALTTNEWTHPYSREKAVFPLPYVREKKFWPFSGRINNAYGDRHLVCTCPATESYAKSS